MGVEANCLTRRDLNARVKNMCRKSTVSVDSSYNLNETRVIDSTVSK